MSAALIELRDVDGGVSCSVHWCDDEANTAPFDGQSHAHRTATMLIAYLDQVLGRAGEASIKTAADIEQGLSAMIAASKPPEPPPAEAANG